MTENRIREVLAQYAGLGPRAMTIADDADLFAAGMTSHASVNVMLGLEDVFDIEFPDEMLSRENFDSVAHMARAIERIQGGAAE